MVFWAVCNTLLVIIVRRNRGKDPCKQGTRRHVTGSETASRQIRAADRTNLGERPYVLEHPPLYAGAVGRNRILFCSIVLFRKVEPAAAFTDFPQARMVAFAKAVEIGFG